MCMCVCVCVCVCVCALQDWCVCPGLTFNSERSGTLGLRPALLLRKTPQVWLRDLKDHSACTSRQRRARDILGRRARLDCPLCACRALRSACRQVSQGQMRFETCAHDLCLTGSHSLA